MIASHCSVLIIYAIPANKNMMPPIQDHLQERIRITVTSNAGTKSPRSRTKPVKKIHNILGIQEEKEAKR